MKINSIPVNKNAIQEVKNVLEYLATMPGKGIISGQHTQTHLQKELIYIKKITGELPALCGFELLAYSPNINYDDSDAACLLEVKENRGTLEKAWEWAEKYKGLITFTWHWFSPLGGRSKSFYTENTNFDGEKAIITGTSENKALLSDMDYMARLLKPFAEKNIPIIWRPFHESEGSWFWWGAKGPVVAKKLYRILYDRFTNMHKLNNLIWVWNSPTPKGYPGDDVTDVVSIDLYPEKHNHNDFKSNYDNLKSFSESKIAALAEIGVIPDIDKIQKNRVPWSWFMIWSNEFCDTEDFTTRDVLTETYKHDYVITLNKLPKLY